MQLMVSRSYPVIDAQTLSESVAGIAPRFVELCEAVVAVNDVKRPSQFGQERDCLFPFRSERQARAAMPEVACRL
jgi:hypothetical protein